jgi:hypothetical protein
MHKLQPVVPQTPVLESSIVGLLVVSRCHGLGQDRDHSQALKNGCHQTGSAIAQGVAAEHRKWGNLVFSCMMVDMIE